MEDIVGLIVTDPLKGRLGFMMWGRPIDPVDDTWLLDALRLHLSRSGFSSEAQIVLCDTLQVFSTAPYSYESIFSFANAGIPFGKGYKRRRKEQKRALAMDRCSTSR